MLHSNLEGRTTEWLPSTKPFINYYTQRILITRWPCAPLQLFRSQVGHRTYKCRLHLLCAMVESVRSKQGETKVTE